MKVLVLFTTLLCLCPFGNSEAKEKRRLEVLFLGSPNGSHRPLDRFRTIRRALGPKGINFTYFNHPTALTKDNLAKYDALLVYGNHNVLKKDQEQALLHYSKSGGACVFLHSACGCFRNSDAFIKLLGAQFKSHGSGVFRVKTIRPDHELMKGYEGFECWDETYVHKKHNPDRVVLQKREQEPWTWVRTNDKGRIFYTASGHDHRCWQQPNYQDLVLRGILWSVGQEKAKLLKNLKLPKHSYYKPKVPIIHRKSWGTPLDRRVPHDVLQNPLPATESLKFAQVPAGYELKLFASEPDIINPIAINWDHNGDMWAVEAFDYPNNFVTDKPGKDRIKILRDTNNDGKADQITVFAEGLTICTSVVPYQQGCITTDGDEMVYLADADNDGKADQRTVLFKGIKIWDTHACVSNLRYGFDGWIYATVGYSGIDIKIADKHVKSGQGAFRFKPDGSDIEFLQSTTNNTWGLGFTAEGRLMGSTANNNPSWWVDVPNRLYNKAGIKAKRTPRADSSDKIFPITFDYLQVDVRDGVTAGAGHAIYTADLFPGHWHNRRALICAPTAKLVTAPVIERHGAGFKTTHFEQNIYASADSWSAPVAAEVGPDGAIYIADWYNSIVQHNVYGPGQKRGKGNAYISEHRDREHGRIYRIAPANRKSAPQPPLDSVQNTITALNHPNLFWRLTAQRLLSEQGNKEQTIQKLTQLAHNDSPGAAHALYTLKTLHAKKQVNELSRKHIIAKTPALQLAAVRNLTANEQNSQMLLAHMHLLTPDARHAALLIIASAPKSYSLLDGLRQHQSAAKTDPHLTQALNVAISIHGGSPDQKNHRNRFIPLSASAKRGAKIYDTATCTACHQAHGEGVAKTFPPLNKSEWLSRNHVDAIRIILKGMSGPISVRGKKYNGGMPSQANLSDRDIADVLNFVRNSWDNALGDITQEEVTRVRATIKDFSTPLTSKDFAQYQPTPSHSYQFSTSLRDSIGKAHAELKGGKRPPQHNQDGIDLTANNGEKCARINNDQYIDLPNKIISKAAQQTVVGELTIETKLRIAENRPWAEAWCFGTSDQGEDQSNGGAKSSYITLIPQNARNNKLRLAARAGGQELFIDAEAILAPGKLHHITATFTRSQMALYLNGKLIGKRSTPEKLDLTKFTDNNNWLGRSQFNDPLFDGSYHSLHIYPVALDARTIALRAE